MMRRFTTTTRTVLFACLATAAMAGQEQREGPLQAFLGEPKFDVQQVYDGGRFPNVLVTLPGTVLAVFEGVKVRRSEDGGETWGPEIPVGPGFMGGGALVNETNGEVLVFVEERHPPAPLTVYRSKDDGRTWSPMETVIHPDERGHVPSMHMNEAGITLRHGEHGGRLVRAARHYADGNRQDQWPEHYTTAIYSDDGGATWNTSRPFADMGTGEAAVAELSNGVLYYNSRTHWYEKEDEPPLRRRHAWSVDGGETWAAWQVAEDLPDGPQDTAYGCMGGLVRLPVEDRDVLLYSNCDSPKGRNHGTVWASFDGGRTWPLKRLVQEGDFAYSSLAAGRPGTESEGWIYLHFEDSGSEVARFNLAWLLEGEATGRGSIPEELDAPARRTERAPLRGAGLVPPRERVQRSLLSLMEKHGVPGASIAVFRDGRIDWAEGYGVLEAGGEEPVTPTTRFQAASISKPVAAFAALCLVKQRRLELDEDVNGYLESWKVPDHEFEEEVTLRRLLCHGAGMTVHGFPGYDSRRQAASLLDILDGKKPANTDAIRVDLEPGSRYRYSGGGYCVLQQMMIDVTERKFPELMHHLVLKPLGMAHSTYEQPLPAKLRDEAARGHRTLSIFHLLFPALDQVVPGRWHVYPEMAAAGLWTTPSDLARFAIAVNLTATRKIRGLVSDDLAKEMLSPQVAEANGLGLFLQDGGQTFGHGGSNDGYKCRMLCLRRNTSGFVLMTNADSGSKLAEELIGTLNSAYGWNMGR